MKQRIVWLVVSGLMVLSLVLASCAPKVTEEEKVVTEEKKAVTEKKEVVTEKKGVVTEKKEVAKLPVPQYGGVLTVVQASDPEADFNYAAQQVVSAVWRYPVYLTNEFLAVPDRAKGPLGTGQWKELTGVLSPKPVQFEWLAGELAESWEMIPPDTFKLKIRKGVRWHDKPPANGAELTPEDVVYSFQLWYGRAGSPLPVTYPYLAYRGTPAEVAKAVYIDPDDPWTVVVKTTPQMGSAFERFAMTDYIVPKALGPIEGVGFGTWRGVVGTGPFYLTDFVSGSSLIFERNPNYWNRDALHPENQLPYVDKVRVFIVPDRSTQMSAIRTGKIDILHEIDLDDAETLWKTNPELRWEKGLFMGQSLQMRNDVAPFDNVNVRRAMMMAIDHDAIVRDLYKGKAVKFYWPIYPVPEHSDMWIPLEEMPRSVQELYEYHPDKAAKLLDEAGYPGPNRFTTSILVSSAQPNDIDLMSVVASYWAKVGVTLNLDLREPGVYAAMQRGFTYPHGVFASGAFESDLARWLSLRAGSSFNYAKVNEPFIDELAPKAGALYFDMAGLARLIKEEKVMEYIHGRALKIILPTIYRYTFWQPWLGGYAGETKANIYTRVPAVGKYVWIDQDLKKAMGR